MICPVVAYAPTAATNPSIAAQPLNFSASGVIFLKGVLVYIWCDKIVTDLFFPRIRGFPRKRNFRLRCKRAYPLQVQA